jgi:hypothetical protein
MSKMSIMEKIYFIAAWVVAGCAVLALILLAIAARASGLLSFGTVLDCLFLGATGCLTLLYFSGWFKNAIVMFIMGWVVGGLALLSMILLAAVGLGGTYTIGTIFWHLALGVFCTLLLLHLSGMLTKSNKVEKAAPIT